MHVYIYDSFVNQKKYNNTMARIETRLTDLGLNGKICRLGAMKNIKDMVKNELSRGAKTIIAVGNDQTVSQTLNAIAQSPDFISSSQKQFGAAVPFGIIPIMGTSNKIADSLGIEAEEKACETLSARRIEKLDLGIANTSYFLSNARISSNHTIIDMQNNYTIELMEEGEISLVNMSDNQQEDGNIFNPQDGNLELFIKTKPAKKFLFSKTKASEQSIFPFKKLTIINNKNYPLILDGSLEVLTPAEISVKKQKISIIVGKGRKF